MSVRNKYLLVAGLLLVVGGAVVMWSTRKAAPPARASSYAPVMPRVGEHAVVELHVPKPGAGTPYPDKNHLIQSASDYRVVALRVECVAAHSQRCRFSVRRLVQGKPGPPVYTVAVDYGTNDLDKRTAVKDPSGRTVSRNEFIGGDPVPFQFFLAFDKSYLAPAQARTLSLTGGFTGRLVRPVIGGPADVDRRTWNISLQLMDRKSRLVGSISQDWASGEWLWFEAIGSSNGLPWYAHRLSLSGRNNKPTR